MNKGSKVLSAPPIFPILAQTLVAVSLLVIIWYIIVNIPLLEEIYLPLPFNLADLLSAIVMTVVVVISIKFGVSLERSLASRASRFTVVGSMVKLLLVISSVLLLYLFFKPLILPSTGDFEWAYHLFFLVLLIGLIGVFIYSIYKSLGGLNKRIDVSGFAPAPPQSTRTCSECGFVSAAGMIFCGMCGAKFKQEPICFGCGKEIVSDKNFCTWCGKPTVESTENSTDSDLPSLEIANCAACGKDLNPGSAFCSECGSRV